MMQPTLRSTMTNKQKRTELTYPFVHTTFSTRSAPPGHLSSSVEFSFSAAIAPLHYSYA